MSPISAVLIAGSVLANIFASLLLKKAALTADDGLISLLFSRNGGFLIGATACYVIAFVLYGALLRDFPVNRAYAIITVLVQAGLVLGGWFFYGEHLNTLAIIGFGAITVGIFMLMWSVQ